MKAKRYAFLLGMMMAVLPAAFSESVPGVFLQEGGWLWSEKDGVMSATVKMSEGTAISVETTGETDASGNPVAKTKEAEYEGSKGKTLTFAQVKYDGKSYWSISNRFTMKKKPAVLVEDCAMYNTKNLADVVNGHLDIGSGIAVGETVKATGGIDITEVSYYSERLYAVRTVYVKSSKISTELDDITAFRILDKVAKTSDMDKKQALFESTETLRMSDKVRTAVQKAREETFAPEEEAPAGPDTADESGTDSSDEE